MPDDATPTSPSGFGTSRLADLDAEVSKALRLGSTPAPDDPMKAEMALNRRANAKSGSSLQQAFERPVDPMFYWRQNNLPFDIWKEDDNGAFPALEQLREYGRLLYLTHPVFGSAIDIFAKYPLTGFEFTCKDQALTDFYTEHFMEDLHYEEYLPEVGRSYWVDGEAFPFAQFNETLGIWDTDELLDPDRMFLVQSPFDREPRFQMELPESLRKIIEERRPAEDYARLVESYPDIVKMGEHDRLEVSGVLVQHLKHNMTSFHSRGVPIVMRAMRTIIQEEMLNSAQDAVASRLYTPLILAKLGASATDLGTDGPWIPNADDIANFQNSVNVALAGDFRMLTYHFGVQMDSVFGRESMPRMDQDFERLTERLLQVFGLSKTMLSGASGGQTYAADALNRDLITQLLTTFQTKIKRFVRERMLVVAEAQQHYDYEERGGKRYPVMEEVLVRDESGNDRIVERPRLLVPDVNIRSMNMRDEQAFRQFLEALRAEGVPISMQTRMVNVPIDLDDERERSIEEQVEQAVAAQRARRETYKRLVAEGLPIPEDLASDFTPTVQEGDEPTTATEDAPLPSVGFDEPAGDEALVPTSEDVSGAQERSGGEVVTLPRNRQRPPESDEMRATMPKPAMLAQHTAAREDRGGADPQARAVLSGRNDPGHLKGIPDIDPTQPLDEPVRKAR